MRWAVFLGLGANLGEPREQLRQAVCALRRHSQVQVQVVSSLYQSKPVGGRGVQPDFFNAALQIRTTLNPQQVLALGQALESQAGRVRAEPAAPRELDIDLLLYQDKIIQTGNLSVPHPRMLERAFVLLPLAEIAPQLRHPVVGQTIAELVAAISASGVRQLPGGSSWAEEDKR